MKLKKLLAALQAKHKEIALREGEKFVRWLEASIARRSLVGDTPVLNSSQFTWTRDLERNWVTIRSELDCVLQNVQDLPNFQDISVDQYSITQDDRWKTYFFYAYGFKAELNCARCPQTTQIIERIPDLKTAFFSILLPHKQIPEHRGPYKGLLRYHLALKVPQAIDQCGIRVKDYIHHWQEGKGFMFDDTFPHAAWNDTDEIRVVLFIDVVRPMQFPYSLFNRLMIQLIAWSPYVQSGKANFLRWEQRYDSIRDRP